MDTRALARRIAQRYLTAASIPPDAGAFARYWTQVGYYPLSSIQAVEKLMTQELGREYDPFGDDPEAEVLEEHVSKVFRGLFNHDYLPAPRGVRLFHSIVRKPAPVNQILRQGLRADPGGVGAYSEAPDAVFFTTRERYHENAPFVVVDIPSDWKGWAEAVNVDFDFRSGKLRRHPEGWVGIRGYVPAKFIVAVNGVPLQVYQRG